MTSSNSIRVLTEHLRTLSALRYDLLRDDQEVLLTAGSEIDEAFKQDLLAQGVEAVNLHSDDAAAMFVSRPRRKAAPRNLPPPKLSGTEKPGVAEPTRAIERLATQLKSMTEQLPLKIENQGPPLRDRVERLGRAPYSAQQQTRLAQQFQTVNKLMNTMVRHAIAGMSQDKRAVDSVIRRTTTEIVQDSDQTIASVSDLPDNPEITARAIRMSVLGMGIAIEMGWDEHLAQEVGTCGLVHDWGVYRLPDELRLKRSPPTAGERALYEQHPLYTFEMLDKIPGVSEAIRLAATQVHERLDGSGYPQGLKDEQIHPYAEILHIADAFVSLTEETWGRPAFVPYDAIVYLLTRVKQGQIKSDVMRALLEAVALFPIGSHVRLSDGGEARVIRRGMSGYAAPVVQRVEADRSIRFDVPPEKLIDLSIGSIKVTEALPHPQRHQQRMDAEQHGEDLLR